MTEKKTLTLNEKVDNYNALQQLMDNLKVQLESLKVEIVEEMNQEGLKSTTGEKAKATLIDRQDYKYKDEDAIISYCRENDYSNYYKTAINKTALNKALKQGGKVAEELKDYYTTETTKVLKVESL